eukprot:6199636-Pleurochrysis_carterae.AAC.3
MIAKAAGGPAPRPCGYHSGVRPDMILPFAPAASLRRLGWRTHQRSDSRRCRPQRRACAASAPSAKEKQER